jgi:hypothetical protein
MCRYNSVPASLSSPPQIIPVIVDRSFHSPPSPLELEQSLVPGFGSAEVEHPEVFGGVALDRFPHDQVVCTEILVAPVRSPVFIHGIPAEVKIDRPGDRASAVGCKDHHAVPLRKHMPLDVSEELRWLRRKSVLASRHAVQAAELQETVCRTADGHGDIGVLRSLYVPTRAVPEASKELIGTGREIEHVSAADRRRRHRGSKTGPRPQLQIVPPRSLSMINDAVEDILNPGRIGRDRLTLVGERQRYAPFARQDTAHLHEGHQRGKNPVPDLAEIPGLIPVGIGKHPRPARRHEDRRLFMRADALVPVRVMERIEDPDAVVLNAVNHRKRSPTIAA